MKKISVIIVCYLSESVIFNCLDSLLEFNDIGTDLEVIVVDNSLSDDLKKEVALGQYSELNLRYSHNPENGGFGQGNNVGAKIAEGAVLFFLNPDTVLQQTIFQAMYMQMKNEDILCAGYKLIDGKGQSVNSIGLMPEYYYLPISFKLLHYLVFKINILKDKIFPWGAALVVRAQDFSNVGMFDEKMFLCNEEPDLVKRLQTYNKQAKVKMFNQAIVHLEGHSVDIPIRRFKEFLRTRQYYCEKHQISYKSFVFFSLVKRVMRFKYDEITSLLFKEMIDE